MELRKRSTFTSFCAQFWLIWVGNDPTVRYVGTTGMKIYIIIDIYCPKPGLPVFLDCRKDVTDSSISLTDAIITLLTVQCLPSG